MSVNRYSSPSSSYFCVFVFAEQPLLRIVLCCALIAGGDDGGSDDDGDGGGGGDDDGVGCLFLLVWNLTLFMQ